MTGLPLYVKNFTDEQYRLYDLDLGLIGFVEQVLSRGIVERFTGGAN